jgi:hypothetical protein
MSRSVLVLASLGATASFAQKPAIIFKAPASSEDSRPLITEIVVGPQGSDYAFKIDFNKEPWGDECTLHCANATFFLDTDNTKNTGLKLKEPKAAETGADMSITIQGTKVYKDNSRQSALKVIVRQFSDGCTEVDQARQLAELDTLQDSDRVLARGTSVYLLIDANLGELPTGAQSRVIYHPPGSRALVGKARGLSASSAHHVELFKDGKLSTPPKKKKNDYEKF